MLARVNSSDAPPLKRPAAFASFTIPVACAPLGIAVFPSTSTGALTVAEKFCPGVLVFEPIASSNTTAITVSAGTTIGFGRGGASFAAGLEALDDPSGADELVSFAAC